MKRKIALLLSLILAMSVMASCDKEKSTVSLEGANVDVNFADYKDSEDIPSWTGEQITVRVWQDVNSPNAYIRLNKSADDVVTPEYTRITGVTFDYETSIDNGGDSYDAKLAKLVAAKDIPAMAYSLPELGSLVEADMLYDLTEYVEQYCPNIMKYFGPETQTYGSVWKNQKEKYGGMYAIPTGESESLVRNMAQEGTYELTDEEVLAIAGPGQSPYDYIYVREDVLKAVYPQAHTYSELEAIYKNNGSFTKEEIFDVPLESPEDLVNFIYKVNDMKSQFEDGQGPIYTTYTHNGSDNWMSCSQALPKFGYAGDCFGYYDMVEEELKITFRQDWYKDIMYTFNKMVRDGVANREALLDTKQTHNEKWNNCRYLVSFHTTPPTGNAKNPEGKRYRKVYLKYTRNLDTILTLGTSADTLKKISFFKDSISEAELVQVLRAIDFSVSMPGQKLTYWGPKSAGLYTEDEDGKLQYVDQKLKDQMLDWGTYGRDLVEKYGLKQGAWPGRPRVVASAYEPKRFYAAAGTWESAYNAAYIDSVDYPQYASPAWYGATFTVLVPGMKSFWDSRQEWEDAMTRVFAAEDDAQFEARFQEMLDIATANGLDDETVKLANEVYKKNAVPFKGNIEAYLETIKARVN